MDNGIKELIGIQFTYNFNTERNQFEVLKTELFNEGEMNLQYLQYPTTEEISSEGIFFDKEEDVKRFVELQNTLLNKYG